MDKIEIISILFLIFLILYKHMGGIGIFTNIYHTNNKDIDELPTSYDDSIFDYGAPNSKFKNYHKSVYLPKNYYKIADETYPDVKNKDIDSLYIVLMNIKLSEYNRDDYDCSDVSAQLEWILEGYGFKTYIASSPYSLDKYGNINSNSGHAWLIVQLDDGEKVAIESTCFTQHSFHPPGIVLGRNMKYKKYSYLYRDYVEYIKKYSNGNYLLPNSFEEYLLSCEPPIDENYINKCDYYYYHPKFIHDTPDEYIEGYYVGNVKHYIPLSEFDWWSDDYNGYFKNKLDG